jgi:hypothetical protein
VKRLLAIVLATAAAAMLATGAARANITDPNEVVDVVGAALEDYWSAELAKLDRDYVSPSGVTWYVHAARTPCGVAPPGNSMYCAADGVIYLDYGLFRHLVVGEHADYAGGVVLAHEWGHAIQDQLGWLRWGIRHKYFKGVELQADCYAGMFSRYAAQQKLLERGDLQEALRLMTTVGDRARLSPTAEGAHGTPKQRRTWFMRGYDTGRIATCNGIYKALYASSTIRPPSP